MLTSDEVAEQLERLLDGLAKEGVSLIFLYWFFNANFFGLGEGVFFLLKFSFFFGLISLA